MPDAVVALVICGAGRSGVLIVNVRVADPVPEAFEAETVATNVPACVGVPVMAPFAALTESPGASADALNEVGELAAVIWKLNNSPTVPAAAEPLVIAGACWGWLLI